MTGQQERGERRVLVVDDDKLVRMALTHGLSGNGVRVCAAADGRDAIERFDSGRYDVVLLDIHLPDANGIDLLARFKTASRSTPVVMISGDARPDSREAAMARGASHFIEKPFDLHEVDAVVRTLIGAQAEGYC